MQAGLGSDVADVPELKQAFRDGLDIHALTAMAEISCRGVDLLSLGGEPMATPLREGDRRLR